MNHDREGSDVAASTRGGDTSLGGGHEIGATIELWRAPSRVWPAFPTVAVARLIRGRAQRPSPAIGGVTVFLDGSNEGAIAPNQSKVYRVSPGEHSVSLHFLGGLRRSRKHSVRLAEGENKQFVGYLNGFAWPSIRPATPEDVAAMDRLQSQPVDASKPA
jgi:hypothetical protein